MKETELAEAVIIWLEADHWEVYQEVQVRGHSGVCDIIAVKDFIVWAIECKSSLTWNVIEQARRWHVHYRSIAIPAAKPGSRGRWTAYHACKNLFQLGVIEVLSKGLWEDMLDVREVHPAPLMREFHEPAKRLLSRLTPEMKNYVKAGSIRGGFWSPYKQTMASIRKYITENPGSTLKEILDATGHGHYAHMKSARGAVRSALPTFESDWCRVDMESKPYKYYIQEWAS